MMRTILIGGESGMIGAGLLSACASTTVTGVWRDENDSSQPRKAPVVRQ